VIEQSSMQIKSFQDLNIWKEAHSLVLEVYRVTKEFPKTEMFGLISQLRRASSSVPANIAEGMGRHTTKELLSFIYNSRGSLTEVIYHLILSKDLGYLRNNDFDNLYQRYNGLAKGMNVFISKLRNK
jgi:four helix bundle protein